MSKYRTAATALDNNVFLLVVCLAVNDTESALVAFYYCPAFAASATIARIEEGACSLRDYLVVTNLLPSVC